MVQRLQTLTGFDKSNNIIHCKVKGSKDLLCKAFKYSLANAPIPLDLLGCMSGPLKSLLFLNSGDHGLWNGEQNTVNASNT